MTLEIVYVLAVAAIVVVLFITEWIRMDKAALAVPTLLLLGGIIDLDTALSGLANPATVAVAAFLVLGLGLEKTGVVRTIGQWTERLPLGNPTLRLLALCVVVAAISPFLSNTAVVVVFMPVFAGLAASAGHAPSRYLIPLSFTAILGGTVTLVGTSTNLIVHNLVRSRGYDELSMFSIMPLGLLYLGIGMVYILTVGRRLLPDRPSGDALGDKLDSRTYTTELLISERSRAVGRLVEELDWRERYGVDRVGALHRWYHWLPRQRGPLAVGDVLCVSGDARAVFRCARGEKLEPPLSLRERSLADSQELRTIELMIAPGSRFVGRSLEELQFGSRFGVVVLALQRPRRPLSGRMSRERLAGGDLMLVQGPPEALSRLVDDAGVVALGERPPHEPRAHGLLAVAILAGVIATATLGVTSITGAAFLGVVAMLFARCVTLDEIYGELDWMIVVLLVGLLPLGIALDQTGAAAWLGGQLASTLHGVPPEVAVACFYLVTSLLTEVMSNQAAAVVLTPIAINTASTLGMNPYAFIVAVMFGASASFMTPIGYQTNALVYAPGGYRFTDYIKVGGPLNLILAGVAAVAIPRFWP